MGEMADLLIDDMMDWEGEDAFAGLFYKKNLRCTHCNRKGLAWRQVQGKWILFEKNDIPHICHGYCPPMQILKEIALQSLAQAKKNEFWKIKQEAYKRGNLIKMVDNISDEFLIDLLAAFIRDDDVEHDDFWGSKSNYKKEIEFLKSKILERMNRQND